MSLKSKICAGLILCASFNSQAFADDIEIFQARDMNVAKGVIERVTPNYDEQSLHLEFTLKQMSHLRDLVGQKIEGVLLYSKLERDFNQNTCPIVDIEPDDVIINKNWAGVPKYYKLPNLSQTYVEQLEQARCAILPIDDARKLYIRAKKILFPENNLNK